MLWGGGWGSPWGLLAPLSAIVRGTHVVHVYSSALADTLVSTVQWSLSGGPSHLTPIVATVTRLASDELQITTDRPLVYGTTYTLTAFDGRSVVFTGLRVDLPIQPAKPDDGILVDYLAPFVNRDGTGGKFLRDAGGDYVLQGGLSSLLGVLWHRILTRVGELYYAPQAGVDLRHKGLRPPNLRKEERRLQQQLEATPYVNAVQVQMTAEADAIVVTIRVDSDLGAITQSKEVSP